MSTHNQNNVVCGSYVRLFFTGLLAAASLTAQVQYTLPSDGYVTVAIDVAQDRRVRNLIGAAPRKAGAQTKAWDFTDDEGNPVPAGRYSYHLLRHIGVGIEYLMSYGNPGTPPWATADSTGGWGADHTLPQAALATRDGVVLGWPMAESGWFLIGVGANGRKQWGIENRYAFGDTRIHLATEEEYLYVATEQNQAPLMRYYKKLAHAVLYRYRLSDRKLAPFGTQDEIALTDKMERNVAGLAVAAETAYVSLQKDNRIIAISLRSGQLDASRDMAFRAPQSLALDRNGSLLVLGGKQIHRIDLGSGKSAPVITSGLEDPGSFCLDAAGAIYVSDRGGVQQVRVFDAAGTGGRTPRGIHQRRAAVWYPRDHSPGKSAARRSNKSRTYTNSGPGAAGRTSQMRVAPANPSLPVSPCMQPARAVHIRRAR